MEKGNFEKIGIQILNRGYLLVFLTAFISGFSVYINKFGVGVFANPYLFTFLKNVVVTIFLFATLFLFKDWKQIKNFSKKDWFLLILIGFFGGSIPFLLFFKGLSQTSAAEGSFLHKTMFIYVTILAVLFLKEKIQKRFLVGASILFLGNFILLKKLFLRANFGNFLIFWATLLWAIENTISKYALKKLEGREVAWGRMFFGSIFILIYLIFTHQLSPILSLNLKQISWVLITSIFLFGYVLSWYSGLKYIPLHQATAILLLGSPITTFLNLVSGTNIPKLEFLSAISIV
ncbi:EamA family transporter, partial [Candidatus Parcubacteria bacterium]|nr:EamA family transporter [Candidatus Parcubacteria bacterium]